MEIKNISEKHLKLNSTRNKTGFALVGFPLRPGKNTIRKIIKIMHEAGDGGEVCPWIDYEKAAIRIYKEVILKTRGGVDNETNE